VSARLAAAAAADPIPPDFFLAGYTDEIRDAANRLRGARFVTFEPGDTIPEAMMEDLTREAARVAAMSREERFALTLDRDVEPGDSG
jgi:hypothetical protein